jgi:hypothetical protein
MPGPGNANVQSVDAVRDVRLSLISFQERTSSALDELRTKIDRTMAWLEQDRPMYWRDQERKAYDRVAGARIAYETCKMKTVGGRHPECIEEKVALQRAKERLEYCKVKIDVVRRWCIEAARQVDEYRGRCSPLKTCLEQDVPNVVAMLARMLDALDAYAGMRSPQSVDASVSLGSLDDESQATEPVTPTEPTPAETDDLEP